MPHVLSLLQPVQSYSYDLVPSENFLLKYLEIFMEGKRYLNEFELQDDIVLDFK
jgi:hypothetical protein